MGRATIVSGGPDGNYQISIDYGTGMRDAQSAYIDRLLIDLQKRIDEAQPIYDAAKADEDAKRITAQAAVDAYTLARRQQSEAQAAIAQAEEDIRNASTSEEIEAAKNAFLAAEAASKAANEAFTKADKEYVESVNALSHAKFTTQASKIPLDTYKSEQAQQQKKRAELAALPLLITQQAWCVDYTEDASADVGTVEIPGENKLTLIVPAGISPQAQDGQMMAREVMSPAQAFWNAAVLPGWQKWMPTYRRGTITAIDLANDTADVSLTDDKSSAIGLGINQTSSLKAIPVDYMDCDAAAFAVGDICVVAFNAMRWETPVVIGFCNGPKPCLPWDAWYAAPDTVPGTSARYFFVCSKPEICDDIVDNPSSYSAQFSADGGAWATMIYLAGYDVFSVGDKNARPQLGFTKSFAMAGIRGVAVDLEPGQYAGATLAFRVFKSGALVLRFAVKNDSSLYSGTFAAVAGAKILDPLALGSIPIQKFAFSFPE